jgi:transcriptional regulator with XRE-family HTH domain
MRASRRQAAGAFGQDLRAASIARGISQEQLATTSDFDRTYPSLLERRLRAPTFLAIVRPADGLNADSVTLLRDAWRDCSGAASPGGIVRFNQRHDSCVALRQNDQSANREQSPPYPWHAGAFRRR